MPRKADLCRGQIFMHGFMFFSGSASLKDVFLHISETILHLPTVNNGMVGMVQNRLVVNIISSSHRYGNEGYGPRDPTPFPTDQI